MSRESDGSREIEALQSMAESLSDIAEAIFDIRDELRGRKPEPEPIHMLSPDGPRSLCGVASGLVSTLWERVSCADCLSGIPKSAGGSSEPTGGDR